MVWTHRVYGVDVPDKQPEPTIVQLVVDPTCGDADTLIHDGLNVAGARLVAAAPEPAILAANPPVRIRVFRPSARLRRGFDRLAPPLFDADHKPTPPLVAWFSEVGSLLRVLEIEPAPLDVWRFSLLLAVQRAAADKYAETRRSATRGRATMINLTEGDPVSVQVDLENMSSDAERQRIALTVPLAAQTGLLVEASGWHGAWRMDIAAHDYIAAVLATSDAR